MLTPPQHTTARPTPEQVAADCRDGLFHLGIACLQAAHDPLTLEAILAVKALLTAAVPPLHQQLGQLELLDRLSGHVHPPPPAPAVAGGDPTEAARLFAQAATAPAGPRLVPEP